MRQSLIPAPDSSSLVASPTSHDLLQLADILWFMNFVRRHKIKLISSVAIAFALGAIYYVTCPRLYESTSQLMVVKKDPLIVKGMPTVMPRGVDAFSTHIALITSPWLADRVLSDKRLHSLKTFAGKANPSASLITSLEAVHCNRDKDVPYSDSNIIEFSFRGRYPRECQDILNAVIDAYRRYLSESHRTANQDASALITKKADQIRQRLEDKQRDYNAFRKTASNRVATNQDDLFSEQRLASIDANLVALEVRRAETMSRLNAWRKAVQDGGNSIAARALLPEGLKPKENKEDVEHHRMLTEKLVSLLDEEQEFENAQQLGAGHPKVKAIRRKIELMRQLFSTPISERWESMSTENLVDGLRAPNPVAEYTVKLEQELEGILASERSLKLEFERKRDEWEKEVKQELDRERDEARKQAEFDLESEQFREAIARDQQLYDALMSQLQRAEIDISSGAYSTVLIAPPNTARRTAPRPMRVFPISIFLGIVGGFAYAISAEIANRLIYSTQEAAHSLNVPVLAQIPTVESKGPSLHREIARLTQEPALCMHGSPDSPAAEAYRILRTAVYFQAGRQPLKIIAITSPNRGDGTSTLTANLAVSIAQSGRQVLLVDANLHFPRIHEVFGVSDDKGLATVLDGKCAIDDAITECGISGLSILPCGPRPSRPADLLLTPYLKEVLETLRSRFDYILVDTPGMLAVAESQILATNADGVLLSIRCGQNGGPAVTQAGDMLERSGANVLGIVLNDADPQDEAVLGDHELLQNGTASSQLAPTL